MGERVHPHFGPDQAAIRAAVPAREPAPAKAQLRATSLERLVSGYYAQAAALVTATGRESGPDAALALYLAKSDPMMVLRDLLGHSSVVTTEAYLRRLDMTRVYADAYERAGRDAGIISAAAQREADDEFAAEDEASTGRDGKES